MMLLSRESEETRNNQSGSKGAASTAQSISWDVSDDLWEQVRPLIPPRRVRSRRGRPPIDDRKMFTAIIYQLRTGSAWNCLPPELGACTTIYERFRLWEQQGFFQQLAQAGLLEHPELQGLNWEQYSQRVD